MGALRDNVPKHQAGASGTEKNRVDRAQGPAETPLMGIVGPVDKYGDKSTGKFRLQQVAAGLWVVRHFVRKIKCHYPSVKVQQHQPLWRLR